MNTSRRYLWGATGVILIMVFAMYAPSLGGGFIWDDRFYLYNRAWLRQGDEWLQIVLHGFPDWQGYFRPLGIAFFTLMLRLFDANPAPMHAMSILLHLFNTALVGAVAYRLHRFVGADRRPTFVLATMAIFGLHPALIEPVAWISSQYDLLVVTFTLLGMLANLLIERDLARASVVGLCFFLAACSKESAISFPFLVFIVDWWRVRRIAMPLERPAGWKRQRGVYAAIFAAGCVYLGWRSWGLGTVADPHAHITLSDVNFALVALTYLIYWKTLLWPMNGSGPMHLVPEWWLNNGIRAQAAVDLASLAILAISIILFWRRNPLGVMMLAFTVSVAPTLHLVTGGLGESFYHERYATLGIAASLTMLPSCLSLLERHLTKAIRVMLITAAAFWVVVALVNIRVTLPLWADEVRLWQWAIRDDDRNVFAKDALLSTYLERGDVRNAQPLAHQLLTQARDCTKCMLNVAFLSVTNGDASRAADALDAARMSMERGTDNRALRVSYQLTLGKLLELMNDLPGAEKAYRLGIAMDPSSPEAMMNLALLQIREGRTAEGGASARAAVDLSPADLKPVRQARLDAAMSAGGRSQTPENDQRSPSP